MEKETITKTSIIWESIMELENKTGLLIPRAVLIKDVIKRGAKAQNPMLLGNKTKTIITKKEIDEILGILLREGLIFYPRRNFVERANGLREMNVRLERERKGEI
jgi:hypothetical protein